jgi:hypothetical protein
MPYGVTTRKPAAAPLPVLALTAHSPSRLAAGGLRPRVWQLRSGRAGDDSGWNIYLTSGSTHFLSLVLGDQLVMITPSGPAQ